jgi:dye decolorizing peroxidase
MFSPDVSADDVDSFHADVPFDGDVAASVAETGVAGHHEKVARARRDGRPRLLRRDFDSADGRQPSVHFLSLQASLSDFRHTRRAMNGWYLRDDHPDVTDRQNNGLLSILRTTARANFYVPPRERRSFPLL